MKLRSFSLSILFLFSYYFSFAQMQIGNEILYGNEWIDASQSYFKIKVGEDGIYRLKKQDLEKAGLPVDQINGNQYQLIFLGKEQPIFVSSMDDSLEDNDFIEFYGQRNRSEIDAHLFEDPENEMLNPDYSLFYDTSSYYLSWNDQTNNLRYQSLDGSLEELNIATDWYWHKELHSVTTEQFAKKYLQNLVQYSTYDVAEGYSSNRTRSFFYTFPVDNFLPGVARPKLVVRLAADLNDHHLNILVNDQLLLEDSLINLFELKEYEIEIPEDLIGESLRIEIRGT